MEQNKGIENISQTIENALEFIDSWHSLYYVIDEGPIYALMHDPDIAMKTISQLSDLWHRIADTAQLVNSPLQDSLQKCTEWIDELNQKYSEICLEHQISNSSGNTHEPCGYHHWEHMFCKHWVEIEETAIALMDNLKAQQKYTFTNTTYPFIYADHSNACFMEEVYDAPSRPNPDLDCNTPLNTSTQEPNRDIFCIHCGNRHTSPGKFCNSCGNPRMTAIDPDATVMFCESCGNAVPMTAKYCAFCGTPMALTFSPMPLPSVVPKPPCRPIPNPSGTPQRHPMACIYAPPPASTVNPKPPKTNLFARIFNRNNKK